MYYDHFGLSYPPFKITPDPQLFYAGGNRGLVLEALIYAIASGEGIIKVVGEVGSGKTMLCRMLEEKLPKHIEIVYLANPRLPPEMVLHAIALELHLPVTPASNRLQVLHDLHLKLLDKHSHHQQVVIFIEEAQGMPLETLEEIRLLSNLETSRHKLLQMVLFGQPELDTNLSFPHIRQLKERITHSFYLSALTRANIEEYLNFRMRTVGYRGPPVFSSGAVRSLTKFSKGLMRRINILADKALLAAFAQNTHLVLPKHVQLAARDSGFLSGMRLAWLSGGLGMVSVLMLGFWWTPASQIVWEWLDRVQFSFPSLSAPAEGVPASFIGEQETETVASGSLLQARLQATGGWLTKADGQNYSIQLMQTDDNLEGLEKWLRKPEIQALLEELYVYRESVKGQVKWGVVYGEFVDVQSANAAIANLPEVLQKNRPYLRRIGSIGSGK